MAGLDDLRKALLSERETGKLLQISPEFFDRARETLHALRENVQESEDPFSDDIQKTILETRSIEQTLSDLFAIRTGKILSLAQSHAQDHYIDREEIKRMIPSEREMFDRVSAAIGACHDLLVRGSAGAGGLTSADTPAVPAEVRDETVAPEPEPITAIQDAPAAPAAQPCTLVRVLSDMDAFMGVDGRTYDLLKGDIVTLPERNAEVLVERNIALNMNVCK